MKNKFNYVLTIFKKIYSIKNEEIEINYGIDNKSRIQVKKGKVDFFENKEDLDFSTIIWKTWKGEKIPFLFDDKDDEIFESKNGQIIINFDIIASSFYFLSNWQEYAYQMRDQSGRFPFAESIQYKLNIVDRPIVNYYFDILKTAVEQAYNRKLEVSLWNHHEFAACITHDIDTCQSAWIEGSFREIKKGEIFSPFKLIFKRIFSDDDWFNFDQILEIEQKNKAQSSFYFLCKRGMHNGVENADYDISHKKFQKVLESILNAGSEIGIHGSFGTYNNVDNFQADLKRLNAKAIGNRFHFLEFDISKSPQVLEQSGIKYDTTLGFAEHYGFRNSFCFPFPLYDIENDKPFNVIEIPLVLMDATLSFSKYMNVTPAKILPQVKKLINEIKKFNGCFTILWHNTHYSKYKYTGWREFFVELLEYCKAENALLTSGSDVYYRYKGAHHANPGS